MSTTITKTEKAKNWLKEYLKEFGEYTGTYDELSSLSGYSQYVMKKAIKELEEEGKVKFEILKGKGISVKFLGEKQKTTEEPSDGKKSKSEKEEKLKKKVSLQDRVLKSLIGKEVKIFLISGTRLEGTLLDFDNFTLSITAPKGKSLIYKHAVATILYE